jgi:hypothetical protein
LKKELFDELVASVREGGAIMRGEAMDSYTAYPKLSEKPAHQVIQFHLGPFKVVHWTRETLRYAISQRWSENYSFAFYGIGLFGYYIGVWPGRRLKKGQADE